MRVSLAAVLLLFLAGCGITIQTGPEDEQRRTEVSETRAKQVRGEYATLFQGANSRAIAGHVKNLIDSVSANYSRYGLQMVAEWRAGNQGRGAPVQDTEIRDLISRSNQSQQALLGAYEDIVELGISRIKELREFDEHSFALLDQFAQKFYEIRSTVFFPSGTVDQYELEVSNAQSGLERASRELDRDLQRY
ncbi:MAG: hypothetical protein NDJ18_07895 [candidate division Zixibacteria bacterium]|nr:hypothetical protein [candidate division Zixibacteria bacterium]